MLEDENTPTVTSESAEGETPAAPAKKAARKAPAKRAAKKTAAADAATAEAAPAEPGAEEAPAKARKTAAKKAPAKRAAKKTAPAAPADPTPAEAAPADPTPAEAGDPTPAEAGDPTPAEAGEPTPAEAGEPTPAEAGDPTPAEAPKRTRARKKAVAAPEAETDAEAPAKKPARKRAAKKAAPAAEAAPVADAASEAPAKRARTRKKAVATPESETAQSEAAQSETAQSETAQSEAAEPAKKPARKRAPRKKAAAAAETEPQLELDVPADDAESGTDAETAAETAAIESTDAETTPVESTDAESTDAESADVESTESTDAEADEDEGADTEADEDETTEAGDADETSEAGTGGARRRRRRGGRRRRKTNDQADDSADPQGEGDSSDDADATETAESDNGDAGDENGEGSGSRRRRRRRRAGEGGGDASDDPANTVTKVRQTRSAEDQITAVSGSTRLEAKKQRRREGREAGRRRAPIVSEAEFLARREAVERVMVIRQRGELTQIGVLEDSVLVEHYVSRESQNSLIGNVYVGRVQNVLPSMEAAFVDIGKGRNAVLYAGEVNWSALGHKEGQPRKIESVLSSGQSVLVQVTKDPVGHKGARLTSQISLAGRFLVYVPDGTTSGISRKLPDTERARLKTLLKEIVPESAGVIVRTAAEGASEEELTSDVERLKARWEDIEAKSKQGSAPKMLYGEPDLTLKVVRDLFTEDFAKLVIDGDEAWDTVQGYVSHIAPDLEPRLERYEGTETSGDAFAAYRIDEQIAKGLDRKVWLPSGGSLIIDRTEAMTVVDVNTGKFTGSGGNLEETVTKNNLEAAEEIVRQLRLRDIGGIIVVDFIDMVLESNRDLVLRRLVECLGRDRTRHQVAEVTSLGLVQMTRKRIGTGLLEAFSENCDHCQGRGLMLHDMPIEPKKSGDDDSKRRRKGKGRGDDQQRNDQQRNDQQRNDQHRHDQQRHEQREQQAPKVTPPSPKDVAAVARPDATPVVDESAPQAQPEAQTEVRSESRSERRSGRRGGRSAEGAPTAEDAPITPTAESPAAELVTEKPAAPVATVVTQARGRRGARSGGVVTPKASEPIVVAAPVVEAAPVVAAAPPKVVTRTRGRKAAEPAESAATAAPDDAELHVPIKKKGSRKR